MLVTLSPVPQVLVTGIAAFLLAGESFAPWQYVGAVALLAGLLMVLFSSYMVRGGGWCMHGYTVTLLKIVALLFR